MNKNTLKIALAIALSGLAMSANATAYTFTALGTGSTASAINASGQIVGTATYTDYTGMNTRGMLWSGSTVSLLDRYLGLPGDINDSGQIAATYGGGATIWNGTSVTHLGFNSYGRAISASGTVVGETYTSGASGTTTVFHATKWDGTTTDLGTLGGTNSYARDINTSGQVVGFAQTAGNANYHATLWDGTTAKDLDSLGGPSPNSGANAINDSGQVVGDSNTTGGGVHATLWNTANNTKTDLGTLGGNWSIAYDINESGQVVGYSDTSGQAAQHATLWDGTTIFDLNNFLDASTASAGWVMTAATGINDNGWIVGRASNRLLGINSAFLLAPVPEPETSAMMLMGLGLMGLVARRRKNGQA